MENCKACFFENIGIDTKITKTKHNCKMKTNKRIHIIGNGKSIQHSLNIQEINLYNEPVILMNGGIFFAPLFKNVLFIGMVDTETFLSINNTIENWRERSNYNTVDAIFKNQFLLYKIKYLHDFKIQDHRNTGIHCIREIYDEFDEIIIYGVDREQADVFGTFINNEAKNMQEEFKELNMFNDLKLTFL